MKISNSELKVPALKPAPEVAYGAFLKNFEFRISKLGKMPAYRLAYEVAYGTAPVLAPEVASQVTYRATPEVASQVACRVASEVAYEVAPPPTNQLPNLLLSQLPKQSTE